MHGAIFVELIVLEKWETQELVSVTRTLFSIDVHYFMYCFVLMCISDCPMFVELCFY